MTTSSTDFDRLARLLQERLGELRLLEAALRQSLSAIAALDLDEIEAVTRRKAALCERIAALDAIISAAPGVKNSAQKWRAPKFHIENDASPALRDAANANMEAQKEIAQLSRTSNELLRRSKLSNTALLNLFGTQSGMTYSNPMEAFANSEGF
jgi:hypothetical protein